MNTADGPSTEATVVSSLETRLKKADVIANKYKKQLVVLQSKLEDVLSGQENHEETMTTNIDKIEKLMRDHQAAVKQSQEMQNKYETDKAALIRDKEGAIAREEELTNVVRHLKDSLAHRERRRSGEYDRGRSSRYGKTIHSCVDYLR
jgi:chromosome segregation ATPase